MAASRRHMRPLLGLGASALAVALLVACATAVEDRPRGELGEPLGGYAGAPSLGGAGGTTTSSTTTSTTTTTSQGGGPACDDTGVGEPNDAEGEAHYFGGIDDCDSSGGDVQGKLAGAEEDWFRYTGTDSTGCVVDPSVTVLWNDGVGRVCQFVECTSGAADVTCSNGAVAATSPSGRPGCCGIADVVADVNCPGLNDDAYIYLRLDEPSGGCVSYVLSYHY